MEMKEERNQGVQIADYLNRLLEETKGIRVSVALAADGAEVNDDEDVAAYLRMLGRILEGIGNQMEHCLQVIKKGK